MSLQNLLKIGQLKGHPPDAAETGPVVAGGHRLAHGPLAATDSPAEMTAQRFAESVVEDAALAWLEALGSYAVLAGPDIASDIVLCDTLHPRLISGEFAERVITEAI